MKRKIGFYWVYGFKWSTKPEWFISNWDGNLWWYDGYDFEDESFIEIDENLIVHTKKLNKYKNYFENLKKFKLL